jgi:thiol-disulfide isomerase/thioredoxin
MPLMILQFKTMKKLLFVFALIIVAGCSRAQTFTPPSTIAPYHILTTDSVYVTPKNLKKHTPVMLIYFAPDCSHCQHLMYEMKPVMKKLKNVQVVMITFVEQIKAIQAFYRDFNLAKYPNFTVGTEGYSYVVQKYYNVRSTPYIALYNKNGKLTQSFEKPPKIDSLMADVKKL